MEVRKNEEKNINSFFSSVQKHFENYPHEIIFVDTGSTDNTKKLASAYTDKIYDFTWIDDFSAARNFSISCASYDWILVLNCDEYILNLNLNDLQEMILNTPEGIGVIDCIDYYKINNLDHTYQLRLPRFFSRKHFHYEDMINEQLVSLHDDPANITLLPLMIYHNRYNDTAEHIIQKTHYSISLLLKMAEEKQNPYLYFQLGQAYSYLEDYENACYYYEKGFEYDVEPKQQYIQLMMISYGYALLNQQYYEYALSLKNIYHEFDISADFVCLMGFIYLENNMLVEAMQQFTRATSINKTFATGNNSFIPTYYMAYINELCGDTENAVFLYEKCGNYQPALDKLSLLRQ